MDILILTQSEVDAMYAKGKTKKNRDAIKQMFVEYLSTKGIKPTNIKWSRYNYYEEMNLHIKMSKRMLNKIDNRLLYNIRRKLSNPIVEETIGQRVLGATVFADQLHVSFAPPYWTLDLSSL